MEGSPIHDQNYSAKMVEKLESGTDIRARSFIVNERIGKAAKNRDFEVFEGVD